MEQRTPEQEKLAREADLLFQFTAGQIENAHPRRRTASATTS